VLKKIRPGLFCGYITAVISMAVIYFLFSDMLLNSRHFFKGLIASHLAFLQLTLPEKINWGIPILVGLIIFWGWLLIFHRE
jgi:hypothetical protein